MTSPHPDTGYDPDHVVIRDNRKIDRDAAGVTVPDPADAGSGPDGSDAAPTDGNIDEVADTIVLDANAELLEERTLDLQRLQAEFTNYRRRAERERLAAGEVATGRVLAELLPVIDDLDRARAHGDLTGALKSVADKLDGIAAKLGLEAFGEVGDPFDPALHEAVMHDESDTVSEIVASTVMRRGYRHRDRLLRPAMVGVTAPAAPTVPAAEAPVGADTLTDGTAAQGEDR